MEAALAARCMPAAFDSPSNAVTDCRRARELSARAGPAAGKAGLDG